MKTEINNPETVQNVQIELERTELVKPTPIDTMLSNEVEALCESFGCGYNVAKGSGDTTEDTDILF
ncbi:FlmA family RiPP peptide [Chryseobacterium phocaeense]|uniref:hypothetical protein n=1 Tax=Chryseobacterium phocaeense TaxID=1816690 RepID=UPI0009BA8A60|nr:hypothetical protein [Chryseobacterium phocaeense]